MVNQDVACKKSFIKAINLILPIVVVKIKIIYHVSLNYMFGNHTALIIIYIWGFCDMYKIRNILDPVPPPFLQE